MSVTELNAKILDGYTVDDQGLLIEPTIPETAPPTETVSEPSPLPTETQAPTQEHTIPTVTPTASEHTSVPAETGLVIPISAESQSENSSTTIPAPLFALIVVFLVVGGFLAFKKTGKNNSSREEGQTK